MREAEKNTLIRLLELAIELAREIPTTEEPQPTDPCEPAFPSRNHDWIDSWDPTLLVCTQCGLHRKKP